MGKKARLKREKRQRQKLRSAGTKRKKTPLSDKARQAELVGRYTGHKRVAIVGIGTGHEIAPMKGEVWVMNDLGTYRYCSMMWDLHDFEWTDEESWAQLKELHKEALTDEDILDRVDKRKDRFKRIGDFCNKSGIPLMSVRRYDGTGPMGLNVPSSMEFPLARVIEELGTDFLNCSMSFAFAMALVDEYTHVDLFGINVETGTEWVYQRDCVSYWIGRMEGAGIAVTINGSRWRPKTILDSQVYGFLQEQDFSHVRLYQVLNELNGERKLIYAESENLYWDWIQGEVPPGTDVMDGQQFPPPPEKSKK